ncbi:MAG: hypothetical protein RL336_1836 [Pseudomonadota bacterium]|jgi:hydroxyacylglutathione hydrolase
MKIYPLPAFNDNYIWAMVSGDLCWVVDPGSAEPVEQFLKTHSLQLEGILITHHHPDHTGGIATLNRDNTLSVVGACSASIAGLTERLGDGESIDVLGTRFTCMNVPGHTLDHISYFALLDTHPILFCGDTLFAAGCGRLFEGTAEQMWHSLSRLAALPEDTDVYPAHEYTLSNLNFAVAVEPDNERLCSRLDEAISLRNRGIPTLPTTIGLEKATNPFLRASEASIRLKAEQLSGRLLPNESDVFAAIRRYKDNF